MVLAGLHTAFGLTVWVFDLQRVLYPWPWNQGVPVQADVASVAWFLIVAIPLFLLGWTLKWAWETVHRLPPRELFVVAALSMLSLAVLFPVSGFWVAAGLCLWLASESSRGTARRD